MHSYRAGLSALLNFLLVLLRVFMTLNACMIWTDRELFIAVSLRVYTATVTLFSYTLTQPHRDPWKRAGLGYFR